MSGISRLTALRIYGDDNVVAHAYDHIDGKFGSVISTIDSRERPAILVTSNPIYETREAATKAAQDTVAEIRARSLESLL